MAQHARHVVVGEGHTRGARCARHVDSRKIHRIDDVAVLQEVRELVGCHHSTVFFRLFGAGADVRHGNDLVVMEQAGLGEVAHIAAQDAGFQGLEHGFLVDHAFTRKIQQHGAGLGGCQRLCIDHVPGGVNGRNMQRNVVGACQQRMQVFHLLHFVGQAPGRLDGKRRIVTQYLHVQGQRGAGYHRTDGTQADNTQRFAAQLVASKTGFFLFQQFGHFTGIGHAMQRLGVGNAGQHAACGQQHAGQNQLLDGVGIGTGRVEHHNAFFSVFRHRNVVDACACAGSGQQRIGHGFVMQLLAAQQEGVWMGHVAAHFELRTGETVQPLDRNGVVGADFVHDGWVLSGVSAKWRCGWWMRQPHRGLRGVRRRLLARRPRPARA